MELLRLDCKLGDGGLLEPRPLLTRSPCVWWGRTGFSPVDEAARAGDSGFCGKHCSFIPCPGTVLGAGDIAVASVSPIRGP